MPEPDINRLFLSVRLHRRAVYALTGGPMVLIYHGGFFTSFLLVRFMRQVLLGKKIGPGKKGYWLPAESYDYFNTLPNELIVWITKYYMLHIIELSIIISGSLFILLDSLLGAVVPGYAAYSG